MVSPRAACLVVVSLIAACGDDASESDGDVATTPDTASQADADAIAEVSSDAADDVASDASDSNDDTAADSTTTSDTTDTIADADVGPPAKPEIILTIAEVPASMNGSAPSVLGGSNDAPLTWRLRVNRRHVTLDVLPTKSSGPIDFASIVVSCTADGDVHLLQPVTTAPDGHARVVVDDASAFPDGAAVACQADVSGPGGSASATIDFDAADLPLELDPFPAVDEWLVVLSRDIFDMKVVRHDDGTASLKSDHVPEGNGVLDFDEPFVELGVFSTEHPEAAAIVKAHMLRKIREYVYSFYGLTDDGEPTAEGVPIRIYFEGDPGAPTPAEYGGARRFSMIALGGDGDTQDQAMTTFGRALIDWNNQDTENDTVYGLGIFPTSLARQVLGMSLGAIILEPYRPAQGGVPFGDDPDDDLFLGQDLEAGDLPADSGNATQRIEVYNLFVEFGALALASIMSHEIGHSLGLVPFGAPPAGLFAGIQTDFTPTLAPDAHIDTEGLNIMQTGGSVNWLEAIGGARPRFEPLSWAYLTRQLVVGPVVEPD